MTPGFLYFHGFNSAPEPASEKIRALRSLARQAGWTFHAPALHYHRLLAGRPETILNESDYSRLLDWLAAHAPVVVAGSSLGGWLAHRWPTNDRVAGRLLINPVTGSLDLLSGEGGQRWVNYVTGEAYCLPDDFRQRIAQTDDSWPVRSMAGGLVLLDLGDEVLDSHATEARLRGRSELLVFAGGSHRFEHLAAAGPRILKWLAGLATQ